MIEAKTIDELADEKKTFALQVKSIVKSHFEETEGKIDIKDSLGLAAVTMSIQELFSHLDVEDDIDETLREKIQENNDQEEYHTIEAISVLITEALAQKPYFKDYKIKEN